MRQSFETSLSRRERQIMDILFERGAATAAEVVAALSDPPVKNTRAMLQIGMLFGLAYIGFLAIWFWSTRFRRRLRRPLRL